MTTLSPAFYNEAINAQDFAVPLADLIFTSEPSDVPFGVKRWDRRHNGATLRNKTQSLQVVKHMLQHFQKHGRLVVVTRKMFLSFGHWRDNKRRIGCPLMRDFNRDRRKIDPPCVRDPEVGTHRREMSGAASDIKNRRLDEQQRRVPGDHTKRL